MVVSFDNKLISSFYLYLDNLLCRKGQAFTNISSQFYRTSEEQFSSLNSYSSPYKSFIYDSSIPNAIIMSGISGANGFIERGTSGIKIDYNNGRILTSGTSNYFSGSYSLRDFNIYVENDSEANIIFINRYFYNPKFGNIYSGSVPGEKYLPGIFINLPNSHNEPFSFGGEDDHKSTIRLTIINDEYNKMIDLISLIKDQCQSYFPILSLNDVPLNIYGDLKTGYYNYQKLVEAATNDHNMITRIEYVSSSMLNDKTVRARGELVSFVDIKLSTLRYPRQYYS